MSNVHNNFLLTLSLSVAVPLWIEELRSLSFEERQALADPQPVMEKGDVMMFGAGKKGEAAKVFNSLARNIAILAFQPGGVTCFGMHFETVGQDSA